MVQASTLKKAPALVGLRPLNNSDIGQVIDAPNGGIRGIYNGVWDACSEKGRRIDRAVDTFAALYDLQDATGRRLYTTFQQAASYAANIECLDGYRVAAMRYDESWLNAIKDFQADLIGRWTFPPRCLLDGRDIDGRKTVAPNNFYNNKKCGAFCGTFVEGGGYLSNTRAGTKERAASFAGNVNDVCAVDFDPVFPDWGFLDTSDRAFVRLVRAEFRTEPV